MFMRIATTALLLAMASSSALAQSATGTNFTTAPGKAPAPAGSAKIEPPKAKIPPSASPADSGLRAGEGAATGEPVEVKRLK